MGEVTKVWLCTLYDKAKLFTDFVDYWWERRMHHERQGNHAFAECCKLVMNGLAGKFGQRQFMWENLVGQTTPDEWQQWPVYDRRTDTVLHYRAIGKNVQRLVSDGWVDTAFVAVAAHINSYARRHMQHLMLVAGGHNVLYIGNDSLFVTQVGYDNLAAAGKVADRELGKLRIKTVTYDAKLHGARDYEIGAEVVKAGLPSEREEVAKRHWRFDVFEDAETLLLRKPDGTVRLHKRNLRGSDSMDFLNYDSSGWYIPPYVTPEKK
jgi:hypothetical protein